MAKEREDLTVHSFMAVHNHERLEDNIEIIASADSEEVSAGDTLNITADIRCLMMGHYFPSGSTEERMLWLEVWATDSAGKSYFIPVNAKGFEGEEYTIADSSAKAYSDMGIVIGMDASNISRDGDVPDGARIFRRPFFNPDGEMTIMQWYTSENTLVDYRFGPRETKTETFTWELPADIATGPITIEFKMYYSLVPSSIGEFLGLAESYYTAYPASSGSIIINESQEPEPSNPTFGEMSIKGAAISYSCQKCHYLGKSTLSWYRDAQDLLQKINGMPGGWGESGLQVLSYFLVEYEWVSADDIFEAGSLSDIKLTN